MIRSKITEAWAVSLLSSALALGNSNTREQFQWNPVIDLCCSNFVRTVSVDEIQRVDFIALPREPHFLQHDALIIEMQFHELTSDTALLGSPI
jgi:hypothetical protein